MSGERREAARSGCHVSDLGSGSDSTLTNLFWAVANSLTSRHSLFSSACKAVMMWDNSRSSCKMYIVSFVMFFAIGDVFECFHQEPQSITLSD